MPREALVVKAKQMLQERMKTYTTTPAEASKLRGVLGFTFTAYYGQVGRGGLTALLQRQYADSPPWANSHTLQRSYMYYWDLLGCDLHRELVVSDLPKPPLI
jgi:hypothetical protein